MGTGVLETLEYFFGGSTLAKKVTVTNLIL